MCAPAPIQGHASIVPSARGTTYVSRLATSFIPSSSQPIKRKKSAMQHYIRTGALMLLLLLTWTAPAQDIKEDRLSRKSASKTLIFDLEGEKVTIYTIQDPEVGSDTTQLVKKVDLGDRMGTLLIYKQDGAEGQYVLQFKDHKGMPARNPKARACQVFDGKGFSPYRVRRSDVCLNRRKSNLGNRKHMYRRYRKFKHDRFVSTKASTIEGDQCPARIEELQSLLCDILDQEQQKLIEQDATGQ